MSKIKQGAFQILSIEIKKFNFEQNQEIQESDINGIKFNNTIGAIAQRRNVQKKDSFLIQLNLDTQANNNNDKTIYNISTSVISLIEFENKNEENKLFLNNAAAIMFSYLRPMIAQITMLSGFPPYHIPPLNFEEFKIQIDDNGL